VLWRDDMAQFYRIGGLEVAATLFAPAGRFATGCRGIAHAEIAPVAEKYRLTLMARDVP